MAFLAQRPSVSWNVLVSVVKSSSLSVCKLMCSCSVSIAWFAAASSRRQIRTITPSVSTRTLFRILPSLIPRLAGACLRSHSHSCLRRPPYTQASLAIRPFTDRLGQFSTVVLYGVFEALHGFFFAFTFWMPFGIVAQSILKNITCFVQNRFVWCGVPKQFIFSSDLFLWRKAGHLPFYNIFAIRWCSGGHCRSLRSYSQCDRPG